MLSTLYPINGFILRNHPGTAGGASCYLTRKPLRSHTMMRWGSGCNKLEKHPPPQIRVDCSCNRMGFPRNMITRHFRQNTHWQPETIDVSHQ